MGKPDALTVQRRLDRQLKVWGNAHTKFAKDDDFYFRTFEVWPKEYKERSASRPSTPTYVIDHAVDAILAFSPVVDKPPAGKGEEHRDKADAIEDWLQAVFDEAALREPLVTSKQLAKHLCLYGYAVSFGPILDLTNKPEEPEQRARESEEDFARRQKVYRAERKSWFPLRWMAPHPSRVLLDPMEKRPTEAIFLDTREAHDIWEVTEKWRRQGRIDEAWTSGDDPMEPLDIIDYWTSEWRMMLKRSGGGELFIMRNTTGFVPFQHAFSGFGLEKTQRRGMGQGVPALFPEDWAEGLLGPIEQDLIREAQGVSAKHNVLMTASYLRRITTKDPAEAAEELRGGIIQGNKGDWAWEEMPSLSSDLFKIDQETRAYIEQGTYSSAIAGQREPGVTTVGQQAILSTAAQRKFAVIKEQLDDMASIVGSNVLRLVDALGESITVRGFTIEPDDIEDYAVRVTFEVVDPVLQLQMKEMGLREIQAGVKSKETYWDDDASQKNATRERRRIFKDLIYDDPRVKEAIVQRILRGVGLADVAAGLEEELKRGSQSGLVDQNGQPISTQGPLGAQLPPTPGGPDEAMAAMRQPLTPEVAKPPLVPAGARL